MRISGGRMGGRKLAVAGKIRPTQDRVRQALFSSIAGIVHGARVLDLFAGSGALGFEALSRGASWVCWVEQDARTCLLLKQAVKRMSCAPDCCRVVRSEVFRFLGKAPDDEAYDVVMADPPYEQSGRYGWPSRLRLALARSPILKPGGIFVMESSSNPSTAADDTQDHGWRLLRRRDYGSTRLDIWLKENTMGG